MSDVVALRIAKSALARMTKPGGVVDVVDVVDVVAPSSGRAVALALRGIIDTLDAAGRPEGRELQALVMTAADAIGPGGLDHLARGDLGGAAWSVAGRLLAAGERAAMQQVTDRFRKP